METGPERKVRAAQLLTSRSGASSFAVGPPTTSADFRAGRLAAVPLAALGHEHQQRNEHEHYRSAA
jgi:hypothetical protein